MTWTSTPENKFWTRETLDRLSEILKGAIGPPFAVQQSQPLPRPPYLEVWREFCIEHNFKPGSPDWYVKKAYYGSDVVADRYDVEEVPIYWEWKNTVVVLNPFFDRKSEHDFLKYKWLEIDEELARKFLVLGVPR